MVRLPSPITASDTRHILRRLRDLNHTARLAISRKRSVQLDGCTSLDTPVERGVTYRVREDEDEALLRLVADGAELDVILESDGGQDRHLHLELARDEDGRAQAPSISARLDLATTDARALEHFLRRLVRGLYAA